MKQVLSYLFGGLLILALLGSSLGYSSQGQSSEPTEADWQWMSENYSSLFERLFPIKKTPGHYVAYRSHQDLYTDVLEYSFALGYGPKSDGPGLDRLSVHIQQADSVSVFDQMMKMHRGNPTEKAAHFETKIKLKKWDFTEDNCPAIQTQFKKFQDLHFGTPAFDVIVMHPMVHEFRVQAGQGDMDFSLVDDELPLVQWALETRRVLESCGGDSNSNKKQTVAIQH